VDDTLKQLRGKGFEAVGAAANVSKLEEIQAIVQLAVTSYGGQIDVVVSNAAVNPTAGAILDTPDWAIDKLLQVNIKSAIQLLREAKPYMAKGSSIVVIASNAAYSPEPPIALYGVTKMALVSLSQALAAELGPEGIRVNAVAPGVVPTKFAAALVEDPAMEEMQRERTWLKRLGTPEDMAAAVAYLASEEAGYVTGECLVVGGGGYSHL
jgi:dehydrogenase/reductase SDR family protein 4